MEAAAVTAATKTAWETTKCSFDFICRRGDYFCELTDNLSTLKNEVTRLMELVEHVQSRVLQERVERMQKRYEVTDWFNRVDVFQIDVLQIINDADEEITKKWRRFLCPKPENCCSCYRVGIRVCQKLECVNQLLTDGNFTDVVETIPNHQQNGYLTSAMNFVLQTGRTFALIW